MSKLGHEAHEMTEAEFLERYQAQGYARPSVTADIVVFTVQDCLLRVLLIKRKGHPYQDHWAIPGGFLDVPKDAIRAAALRFGLDLNSGTTEGWPEEAVNLVSPLLEGNHPFTWDVNLDACAHRELAEETSLPVGSCFLEQLYTFGSVTRDPRTYVATVAYYALVPSNLMSLVKPQDDAKDAQWFEVEALDIPLAFDHKKILDTAVDRIRGKLDYFAAIAGGLLPPTFTESELRAIYETIKGEDFNRGTFSRRFKRMQEDGHIVLAKGRRLTRGRPASVYTFAV